MRAVTPGQFGVTYEKMEKPESVHWPCPTIEHPGTPILHIGKFSAADGKGTMFGLEYHPPAEVADAEYPFTLMTGRIIFHYHTRTQTDRSPTLHNDVPENYMQMNTQDAKELGIRPYEKVKVTSRRGESIAIARVTDDVGPKVLFMPMHFAHGANDLTNTALDPLSKMPELKHCAVKIEKITGA
jgi:formate dehydrogenase major subunit